MNQLIFFALVATAVFSCVAAAPKNPIIPMPICTEPHETAYTCGKQCEKQCNKELPGFCKGILCPGLSCGCQYGFERNQETDSCVPTNECPKK